jgi:hypothetical protein
VFGASQVFPLQHGSPVPPQLCAAADIDAAKRCKLIASNIVPTIMSF